MNVNKSRKRNHNPNEIILDSAYCLACSGNKTQYKLLEQPLLCPKHLQTARQSMNKICETLFNGNFEEMVVTLLVLRNKEEAVNSTVLNNLIQTKMKWAVPLIDKHRTKTGGRFNTTQALKRYCRDQFRKNSSLPKPPSNSKSKQAFVKWAISCGINISHFQTRSYKKKQLIPGGGNPCFSDDGSQEECSMSYISESEEDISTDGVVSESYDTLVPSQPQQQPQQQTEKAGIKRKLVSEPCDDVKPALKKQRTSLLRSSTNALEAEAISVLKFGFDGMGNSKEEEEEEEDGSVTPVCKVDIEGGDGIVKVPNVSVEKQNAQVEE